jgi:thiol-disulfide isomerase/thioredoxin
VASLTGVLVVVAALAVATAGGVLWKRRNGNFRESGAMPMNPMLAELGVTADGPVTLLQFSSAFCAPCRATRVLCADVAARVPGVRHVEVDAESHLDAVRALEIWRTPTVLVVDDEGQVRRRASGAPTRAQLLAAVAELLPAQDLGTPVPAE